MMAGLSKPFYNVVSVEPQKQREVIEIYATNGSFADTARILDIDQQAVRRIVKSPQGSFALEQLLRERARTRALKLGALTDRAIDEMDICLTNGNERILNSRRDGDPITVFLRPDIKDLTGALAWMTHHMREVSETLSAIDVTNHDVSHEARSQNLTTLKELVALEERRLLLDAERQARDVEQAPPVVDAVKQTPWSRGSWGGNASTNPDRVTHRTHKARSPEAIAERARLGALASTSDSDACGPVGSSAPHALGELMSSTSAGADSPVDSGVRQPQEEADLMRQALDLTRVSGGSRDRPPTPAPAREAAPETSPGLGDSRGSSRSEDRSSSEVTWEDLEEE